MRVESGQGTAVRGVLCSLSLCGWVLAVLCVSVLCAVIWVVGSALGLCVQCSRLFTVLGYHAGLVGN